MQPDEYIEIYKQLEWIKGQLTRLVDDAESEKETRRRRNMDFDKRVRELERWKDEFKGKMIAFAVVGGAVWGIIMALILKYIG